MKFKSFELLTEAVSYLPVNASFTEKNSPIWIDMEEEGEFYLESIDSEDGYVGFMTFHERNFDENTPGGFMFLDQLDDESFDKIKLTIKDNKWQPGA